MNSERCPPAGRGAWSTEQLRSELGWRDLADAVSSGVISHPWRGAYHHPEADLLCRLQALQKSVGGALVACHTTGAQLHGFGILDDGLLHVTTPDGRSLRRRPGVLIHQRIPRRPLVELSGFLVTDPADTAIDVARSCADIDILPVLDATLRSGVDRAELRAALDIAAGARGIVTVRRWLDCADGTAESPMESRSRFRVIEARLPVPEVQVVVHVSPSEHRRLDLGWRHRRVGLDYDGEDFHSGDGSMARDRRRHNQLTAAGWTVLYATASDIYRNPTPLIGQLHRLLA